MAGGASEADFREMLAQIRYPYGYSVRGRASEANKSGDNFAESTDSMLLMNDRV